MVRFPRLRITNILGTTIAIVLSWDRLMFHATRWVTRILGTGISVVFNGKGHMVRLTGLRITGILRTGIAIVFHLARGHTGSFRGTTGSS